MTQEIIVHLKNGTEFTFTERGITRKVTLEKIAKELKRNGCALLGDDTSEVLLFEDEIMWIRSNIR